MRFLFVTYCFGNAEGQALIGVYKRGLRVGMELCDRGHEVVFFCTGREAYRDKLTETAETRMHFVDIPFSVAAFVEARQNHRTFLKEIKQIKPDFIVIGEAPLAGALLEATLCAVELRIPVVFLDNAYNPLFVDIFYETLGPMADGIILTGPSSHHTRTAPVHLCQVPPFIESSLSAAKAMLTRELDLKGEKMVTVLAYDSKVEKLGTSLMKALDGPDLEFLFCARDPEKCREQLGQLPNGRKEKIRVIAQPPDQILFGLLELSRLAVVKYGFMQVSECLALRTPVIVVYHEGPLWLDFLPEICRQFAWVTSEAEADQAIIDAARRFLDLDPSEMAGIHEGELNAVSKSADFLESFPQRPRSGIDVECERLGFTKRRLLAALRLQHPHAEVMLHLIRAMRLRVLPEYQLYSVVCAFSINGVEQFARLWARLYTSGEAAYADFHVARVFDSGRRVFYFSEADRILIEEDIGQAELPPLIP